MPLPSGSHDQRHSTVNIPSVPVSFVRKLLPRLMPNTVIDEYCYVAMMQQDLLGTQ